VAAAGRGRAVSVWRLDVPEQAQRVIKQGAWDIGLTPDARRLLTADGEETVCVWDSASGRLLRRHENLASFFALTSGGKKFVSARGGAVVQIDLADGHEEECYNLPSGKVLALASNPEGKLIAVTNDDAEKPRVIVFDIAQKRIVRELTPTGNKLTWVVFSRDGTMLAHRASWTTVDVWRWQGGLQHAAVENDVVPYCGVFHTDQNIGLRSAKGGYAMDHEGQSPSKGANYISGPYQAATNELVLGDINGVVSFWNIDDNDGKLRPKRGRQLKGHRSIVTDIDFTRDGRRMVTGGADGTVRIWDPAAGLELLNLRHYSDDAVMAVAFADQDWRVISGGNKDVKMWDAALLSRQATRDDPWCYLVRGCVRSDLGDWEGAVEDFSEAIERGVDDPYVWQYRGATRARLRQYPAALDDLSKAVECIPNNDPSVWLDRHLARAAAGDVALAEQDYGKAVECVGEVLQAPDNKWWYKVSLDREDAQRLGWERLIADLTRTIDRGNAPWYIYRARGLARADVATYGEALGDFLKATELKPDDWQSWRGVARSQMGRDTKNDETDRSRYEAAVAAYDRAIELKPDGWDLYYLRGLCFLDLKRLDKAVDDFTQAIAHRPNGWAPWAERGSTRLFLRRFPDAVADFSQAQRLGAPDDECAERSAWAYLGREDFDAYHKLCEDWLGRSNIDTITPATANTVAWACAIGPHALTDPMRAVRLAEKAVVANPDTYAYVSTLATTLHRAGQYERCIARLDEAVKIRREGATAYDFFFYALAHHALGHVDEARQSFNKGLDWMAACERSAASGAKVGYWSDMDRVQYDIMRREVERTLGIKPP
ncbi:MAG: tetratricopeptide repeat protein, partial [Planctomycetaceae bacterium]|nr:tetratricopeptide repeat protein [Planctomycetaceae bacterium]